MTIDHLQWLLPLLMVVGFVAGLVDSIAGGGGLIVVPTLLYVGLAPATVLGTNRLQSCVGELSASIHFARKKHLKLKPIMLGIVFTAIGSTLGTILVQHIHAAILQKLIPIFLLIIVVYMVLSSGRKKRAPKPRLSRKRFLVCFGLLIGFYNGFFGPATGTFWIAALMYFLAHTIVEASIQTKPLNFTGNVVSLAWFAAYGHIQYLFALAMGLGQVLGASIGARLVIHKGHSIIKPLLLIVVVIMSVNLLVKDFF